MLKNLRNKLKESVLSVLPVTIIVLVLYFVGLVPLTSTEIAAFAVSAVFLVLGIALFTMGADMAMTPMGEFMGSGLIKRRNLGLLLILSLTVGVLITVAEPDLWVLAKQVKAVINDIVLIACVGVGVGVLLMIGIVKIVFKRDLTMLLLFFYLLLFCMAAVLFERGNGHYLSMAFDSGGVTTGPITVPFIMAFGVGIAGTLGGKRSHENSFGLIALCSVGPILAVLVLSSAANNDLVYTLADYSIASYLGKHFFATLGGVALEVTAALSLILLFFVILQVTVLRLPRKMLVRIFIGIIYTFVGLVVFLTAVKIGFMPVGFLIGRHLADNQPLLCIFGFVLGLVVVFAEPAVQVLNRQVETITAGTVTKRSMLVAMCIGVGISICLSMVRIIYGFSILYYLIPGYIISLALSFFVPRIYTAIAFDSGGVASGPLTSGFILPLAIGACSVIGGENSVLSTGFGIVAMVALTPLITIQLLGFRAIIAARVRERIVLQRILAADDEQIIQFM